MIIVMEEYIDFVLRSSISYDRNEYRYTLMWALWFGRSSMSAITSQRLRLHNTTH
jgi:hypothetical protein